MLHRNNPQKGFAKPAGRGHHRDTGPRSGNRKPKADAAARGHAPPPLATNDSRQFD
jgi:hypothetical protein